MSEIIEIADTRQIIERAAREHEEYMIKYDLLMRENQENGG